MNKTQLVDCIQAKLGEGATKKCAETALNAVLDAIKDAVRTDKVQELKTSMANGTYNVPMSALADKLLNGFTI